MIDVMTKIKAEVAQSTSGTIRNNIVYIDVKNIRPNPYQPRKTFDKAGICELSQSIQQYGVIQPITVRRFNNFSYELVSGERRLRASIEAGISKIPAIILSMSDNDSAVVALIENLQRQDLSFLEEAQAYYHLLTDHGFTQEELALKIGKTQSTIANKVRLLKLSDNIRRLIASRGLTERHARALLRLPDEQSKLFVLKKICDNDLNVKETDDLVEQMLTKMIMKEEKEECSDKNKLCVLKDVRIFLNTIKHAIGVMKQSGINAVSTQSENDLYYEYLIKIPKKANEQKL